MNPVNPVQVLIVAKTRMKSGICVGGITQDGRSVRLCAPRGSPMEYNDPYAVGDVWRIAKWRKPGHHKPPHTEDIEVLDREWLRASGQLLPAIEKLMPPVCGALDGLFDGMVCQDEDGRAAITRAAVPGYSTLFWRPDRPLRLCSGGATTFRYRYPADAGDVTLSYTGLAPAEAVLPAGALLRISLARWWRPHSTSEEFCHLQVSGWYAEPHLWTVQTADPLPDPGQPDPDFPVPSPPMPAPSREPSVLPDLDELLQRHFGFTEFRPFQREVIEAVLAGRDVVAVMPTGGGKSLCYQLPALVDDGLTLVVSPLISLMQDQVKHLQEFGIEAAALNSQMDGETRRRTVRQAQQGQLRLLFMAPETLLLPDTLSWLPRCRIARLVVDEAHCISRWGHDFRPEYRRILEVRKRLGEVPVLALTATATLQVRRDIVETLELRDVAVFVAPFDRPNLFLSVQPRRGDGLAQVLEFVAAHPQQSGIIYCSTRRQVDELNDQLQAAGIQSLPYHAGLDDETRIRNQRRFVYDEVQVMVATIAFGMGIDKPDVRFVLNYSLPQDPESYYQQIGRAGRDGDPADCLLLHAPGDFNTARYMINQSYLEHRDDGLKAEGEARLQHMGAYIKHRSCRRKWLVNYFGDSGVGDRCKMCDACRAAVVEPPMVPQTAHTHAHILNAVSAPDAGGDDLTEPARLFLECVRQVRQSFGVTHIIDILRRSRSKKVLDRKHDRLASYGQGTHLRKEQWQQLVDLLFRQHRLVQDEHGALHLTAQGQAVLDGAQVFGRLGGGPLRTPTAETPEDSSLFEHLRSLRWELANARGTPAYTIFPDRTLREMATHKPQSLDEIANIYGVGEHKLAQFGEVFVEAIRAYQQDPRAPVAASPSEPQRIANVEERRATAIALLQAGKSLEETAEECGVQPSTVVGYIERLVENTNGLPKDFRLPAPSISIEDWAQVMTLFAQHGTESLLPMFRGLDERVEYIDLRLLRIAYLLGLSE